jgi:hypothetical protein
MATLPLFLETDGFRAVHACWDEAMIAELITVTNNGVLTEGQITQAADKRDPLWRLVETVTKGPEVPLPMGYSFQDRTARSAARCASRGGGVERHPGRISRCPSPIPANCQ